MVKRCSTNANAGIGGLPLSAKTQSKILQEHIKRQSLLPRQRHFSVDENMMSKERKSGASKKSSSYIDTEDNEDEELDYSEFENEEVDAMCYDEEDEDDECEEEANLGDDYDDEADDYDQCASNNNNEDDDEQEPSDLVINEDENNQDSVEMRADQAKKSRRKRSSFSCSSFSEKLNKVKLTSNNISSQVSWVRMSIT
jgi:hypothetical protein